MGGPGLETDRQGRLSYGLAPLDLLPAVVSSLCASVSSSEQWAQSLLLMSVAM